MRYSFALCLVLCLALSASAKRAAPPPAGLRVATADAVVIGKVTDVAAKAEAFARYLGDKSEMKFATVQVESAVLGKPGKTVQVGFVLQAPNRRGPVASLTKGQEVCLFLTAHPTKKGAYYLGDYEAVLDKKDNPDWKKEIEEVKKSAKLLATPMKGLKSKEADERLLTAALLINRYKNSRTGTEKTESVPAAESKLILTALAEASWATPRGGNWMTNPQNLFYRLGVTAKDGWEQPKDFRQVEVQAKKWLKDNAGKFKMERYVRPRLSTEPDPEP